MLTTLIATTKYSYVEAASPLLKLSISPTNELIQSYRNVVKITKYILETITPTKQMNMAVFPLRVTHTIFTEITSLSSTVLLLSITYDLML